MTPTGQPWECVLPRRGLKKGEAAWEESAPATAALNVGLTLLGGLMAGWLGLVTARQILGR